MSTRAICFSQSTKEQGVVGIELVEDDDVVVIDDRSAIERFLDHVGLVTRSREFDQGQFRTVGKTGAAGLWTASSVVEQSVMYLKLTPEFAKRLKDAGSLVKTKTRGISHAMLWETGKTSLKWVQVESGPASLLTDPAVLSGVGGS